VRSKAAALADDPDENVRCVALRALGRTMDEQALRAVIRVLKRKGESGRVKIAALEALGQPDTFPEYAVESMADPDLCDDGALMGARRVLGKSDSPRALAALDALCKRPNHVARLFGAMALSGKSAPEARNSLIPLLDDPHNDVRCVAMSALASVPANLRRDTLLPKFVALLQDPDGTVRASAAYALGRSEDLIAVEALLHALAQQEIPRDFQVVLLTVLGGVAHSWPQREGARKLVKLQVDLFADILKQSPLDEGDGPADRAATILESLAERRSESALAALKRAAQTSPDSVVGRQIRQFLDDIDRRQEEPLQIVPKGEP
jgi:HEAT repeat protein